MHFIENFETNFQIWSNVAALWHHLIQINSVQKQLNSKANKQNNIKEETFEFYIRAFTFASSREFETTAKYNFGEARKGAGEDPISVDGQKI